jgi:hypothetical protein
MVRFGMRVMLTKFGILTKECQSLWGYTLVSRQREYLARSNSKRVNERQVRGLEDVQLSKLSDAKIFQRHKESE